ncbi:putative CheY-like receiver [Vibrio nigripulchritudo SO65]|uniref:response regulator n=1 Tax=Vibrio nigripulchritudo TaxID=28173 RepID=UPI0003B20A89|nr:response regulator [Vibrio nigripulchritudo]CCN33459.1 putative CheY-like receiver [Vibrio nigripulchritudo AM115]CCN41470.1 putative CheY-like receiver [Vibrio nigripulchritudo FTn2]CCN64147.1 putative CheY-like receiver [Vibrio nigripulchritudo POn4]CCN75787.1 putative CheY-like receiver [Vibrio nigripulchritudo SO65]
MMNSISNKKVLLIDDCELIRGTSRIMILKLGFQPENIFMCATAKRGLQLCKAHDFDVVIIDQNLGEGASGLDFLKALHIQQLRQSHTIIIVATADNSSLVVQRFSQYRPNSYIVKPLRMDSLTASIQTNLEIQILSARACEEYHQSGINGFMTSLRSTSSPKKVAHVIEQFANNEKATLQHRLMVLQAFYKSHPTPKLGLGYAFLLLQDQQVSRANDVLTEIKQKSGIQAAEYFPLELAILLAQGKVKEIRTKLVSLAEEKSPDSNALSSALWLAHQRPELLDSATLSKIKTAITQDLWFDEEHKLLLCSLLAKGNWNKAKLLWDSTPLAMNNRFSDVYKTLFVTWSMHKMGEKDDKSLNSLLSSPLLEHSPLANLYLADLLAHSSNDNEINKTHQRINHNSKKVLCFFKRLMIMQAINKHSKEEAIQLA